jgi:hypothetical protein
MFIIPYMYKVTKENNVSVHAIHLLTIAGKHLWEEESHLDIDHDILEPNELFRKGDIQTILKHVKLCEIDKEKTNVHDFYKWREVASQDDSTFCWKSYFHLEGDKRDSWLPIPPREMIGSHSVSKIIEAILEFQRRDCEVI